MLRAPIAYALLAFAAPGLAANAPATAAAARNTAPVKEAWDRTAPRAIAASINRNPVPGRPSAGYVTIEGGGQPDRLVGATAPGTRIELHSMSMTGGVMQMRKLEALPVPAGSRAVFAPGGNHLMIFGLTSAMKSLEITFDFASGKTARVVAPIHAAGAMDHEGH